MEVNNDYLARIAKHIKTGIPYSNRTFECLSVRLKIPQFTCITLQSLFIACPEVEVIIAEKAKTAFYRDMIELQNFLMVCAITNLYRGVTITQEYFYYMEQLARFLKAQINITQCSMLEEKIIKLFDYGMIDYIIFNKPEETFMVGEKMKLTVGNITTIESVQAQIYSFPPKSHGLTEELARHEIFLVPYSQLNIPSPFQEISNLLIPLIFIYISKRKRKGCISHFGIILIFLQKEELLQIWGPGHQKMRCPFASEGHQIAQEDVVERLPRWNGQYVYNAQNHFNLQPDLDTSEEIEEENEE